MARGTPQPRSGLTRISAVIATAVAAIAIVASVPGPARGTAPPSSQDNLYARAATQAGVPLDLLVAIAGAESGYHPWALNVAGRQIYCHSRTEAEQILARDDRVAIGLMQINWRFWGPRIGLSKAQLLDPATNLIYGARILKEGLRRDGNVWHGISNYHSGSLERRDKYNRLVYDHYLRYLRGDRNQ